jgi:hypothetical protein
LVEKPRDFVDRPESGRFGQRCSPTSVDGDVHGPVMAIHLNSKPAILFFGLKVGVMVNARKEPAAEQRVKPGIRISARDKDALASFAVLLPLDGDAVSRIF